MRALRKRSGSQSGPDSGPDSGSHSGKRPNLEKPRAHIRALRWLTRRDYSAFELQARLSTEGYTPDEINDALLWLKDGQWQSDERFAGSLARRRSGAYGSRLIRAELEQHRVDEQSIGEALQAMEQTDAQRAFAWLEKRSRSAALTPENRARWYRALMARGFAPDDVRDALRLLQVQRQDDLRDHDTFSDTSSPDDE